MTFRTDFLASGLVNITPSDTTVLDLVGIVINAASGTVATVDSLGNTCTITVAAPIEINARIVQVKATGTTVAAAAILGLKP